MTKINHCPLFYSRYKHFISVSIFDSLLIYLNLFSFIFDRIILRRNDHFNRRFKTSLSA